MFASFETVRAVMKRSNWKELRFAEQGLIWSTEQLQFFRDAENGKVHRTILYQGKGKFAKVEMINHGGSGIV